MNKQEILKRMRGINFIDHIDGQMLGSGMKPLNIKNNVKLSLQDPMENTPSKQFAPTSMVSYGETSISSNVPNIGKGLNVKEIIDELDNLAGGKNKKKKNQKAGFY